MSQGTPINKLGGNDMNDEDSRLVDSILNDLNGPDQSQGQQDQQGQQGQQGQPAQQLSQEEHRAMLEQRQQQMMQQQMMQQQMMMQQQRELEDQPLSVLDKIQLEWKRILLVIVLSVIINTSFMDSIFKLNDTTYFIQEDGTLNMQAVIIKGCLVGGVFFLLNTLIDQ